MASTPPDSSNKIVQSNGHQDIVNTFRKELFDEGILHEGDSIGTDDITME